MEVRSDVLTLCAPAPSDPASGGWKKVGWGEGSRQVQRLEPALMFWMTVGRPKHWAREGGLVSQGAWLGGGRDPSVKIRGRSASAGGQAGGGG